MEKRFRLRKNYQFNYVYKNGKSVGDGRLTVVFCKNKNGQPKIGFSIGKKYGKAVKRNRIKRQLKEIINARYALLDSRYNYIFIPRAADTPPKFSELASSADELIKRISVK